MSQIAEKNARNLVVMLTAGANISDLVEMAKSLSIRATHIQQLAVPKEEESARLNLITALKFNGHN